MENRRVGFAESIYSTLSLEESTAFNKNILLNMSSFDIVNFYTEQAGFGFCAQFLLIFAALCSLGIGAAFASFLDSKPHKKARISNLSEFKETLVVQYECKSTNSSFESEHVTYISPEEVRSINTQVLKDVQDICGDDLDGEISARFIAAC